MKVSSKALIGLTIALSVHFLAHADCATELQMQAEFDKGCKDGNVSFCEGLKETRKNIASMGCKGIVDERRQYETYAGGRWSDYMLSGSFEDAAKHADYWAWSLEGRDGSGLDQYYRLVQSCLAWGKVGNTDRKDLSCSRLKASKFYDPKKAEAPWKQGEEVRRYFAELSRPERERLAREQQLQEDQLTAIRRQEVFSAVNSAAQALSAQQRTNDAIDAQMKADAARRNAEQEHMRRALAVSAITATTSRSNSLSKQQSISSSGTASQMHSGSARDMTSPPLQIPAATSPGPVAVAQRSAQQEQRLEIDTRGDYIVGGRSNLFRVYVTNRSPFRGTCLVNGTYEYVSDPDGRITSNAITVPIVLAANGSKEADFTRDDRNITMKEWKVTCQQVR